MSVQYNLYMTLQNTVVYTLWSPTVVTTNAWRRSDTGGLPAICEKDTNLLINR